MFSNEQNMKITQAMLDNSETSIKSIRSFIAPIDNPDADQPYAKGDLVLECRNMAVIRDPRARGDSKYALLYQNLSS